ncbi:DUF2235 domain-containing protein [Mycobacteroides chelonae]|uniref:DUF2235 domain-containing protein n=1 Tax=Mycobacteroides chelonae TaxID=1774 RepID=UPI0008A8D0E4|nr:DUF2235 domain-containing protein [Mycobacteroides chelonae]OHU52607.1 hypothetical protein BKG81_01470 [Mycobacteroides chelonae]
MTKNIVICFDGTGNQIRAAGNTNVVRGYDMVIHDLTDRQISYYDPGVGTDPAIGTYAPIGQFAARIMGIAFGVGLRAKLAEAYTYLIERWQPGDRIFIFGFSRGAFCARGLAGLLNSVGMLRPGSQNLVPYAVSLYAQSCESWSAERWDQLHSFSRTVARREDGKFAIPIAYLGLWDTVSAPGIFKRSMQWPYAPSVPNALAGRHAVAIDEKRRPYREYLIKYLGDQRLVDEAWFAGIHSDVGGDYTDDDRLSDIALKWVIDGAAEHGLLLNTEKYQRYCSVEPAYAMGEIHRFNWLWALLIFRRRRIPNGAWIHASVADRMAEDGTYRPSLPERTTIVDSQWASPATDIRM